jgi:SPP1 family predicted phage head-tail adaptor
MQLGALDKRVTLQYETSAPDGMGGFTTTWADSGTTWAAIWPVSASEQISASSQTLTITHRVRIRYRAVVRASWRVLYNGRYFAITSIVDPNMKHEWLDLLCKEVIA